jgi:hypothetical protein
MIYQEFESASFWTNFCSKLKNRFGLLDLILDTLLMEVSFREILVESTKIILPQVFFSLV